MSLQKTSANVSGTLSIDRLANCRVNITGRIIDALRTLDQGAIGIALVLDEHERLVGTITDGDIRRAILNGATTESQLAPFVQTRFTSVGPQASRAEVLDLMQARLLNQVPILNAENRLVGLHLLHEILGASVKPNWAVIMAGGKGTRLHPITEHIPKPMIKVAGRPILERLVLHLVGFGIRRIYLSINHLGHIIEEHFGDGQRFGCTIDYLREVEPLGTGGALSLLPENSPHPLLVMNGDLVTQVNLDRLLSFHADGKFAATMGVQRYTHQVPFGCVESDGEQIIHLEEKPLLQRLINAGIYVFSPEIVGQVPRKFFPITELFATCLERRVRVGAFEVLEDWLDVGQREQLKQAQKGNSQ